MFIQKINIKQNPLPRYFSLNKTKNETKTFSFLNRIILKVHKLIFINTP